MKYPESKREYPHKKRTSQTWELKHSITTWSTDVVDADSDGVDYNTI
jgi:hypothetical protein